jgi:hypothetical protein
MYCLYFQGRKVSQASSKQSRVSWIMTPCCLAGGHQHFAGTCWLNFQDKSKFCVLITSHKSLSVWCLKFSRRLRYGLLSLWLFHFSLVGDKPEDESSSFLRNIGNHTQEYTFLYPRRPEFGSLPAWKFQILYVQLAIWYYSKALSADLKLKTPHFLWAMIYVHTNIMFLGIIHRPVFI